MGWIPSRKRYGWRKCSCTIPTKEYNDLMRRVHAREGEQFKLPGIDPGEEK